MSITARIAIIGAGPAGLTAARELQGHGARVVVYEAEGWVGGKMRTDRLDDFLVDTNAQLFGSMYTRFLSLVEELGIRDRLVRAPGRDALWRNGRVHEVVYGSVSSMLASGGLPLMTKLKLGTHYLPFLTRNADNLSLHAPERAGAAGLDGESIAAWGAREMGSDFVDYLVYPQLTGFYGALPEETSAGMYHIVAGSAGVDVVVYGLRGGTATLCEALADRVVAKGGEMRLRATIESLESDGSGVVLSAGGAAEKFDAVVMATPAPPARDLLRSSQPRLAAWLDGVRTRPAVTVGLLLDKPAGVRWFGLSFPRDESTAVAAICVQENKGMVDVVPDGKGALVVYVRPDRAGELIGAESRTVVDAVLPDVFRAIPGAEGHVRRARVYRWPHGNALMYPGYLSHLGEFRRGGVEEGKVALAGDYLYSPSVEGAVLAGSDAASRLRARLGGR